jgi:hypothetical protein
MRRSALSVLLLMGFSACTSADASPYDSSNPIHCMTIFGATSGTARTGSLADELNARMVFIVRSNGGQQWLREISPAAQELGAQWQASQDRNEVLRLFEECRNRQDADPNYRAALPNLMREGRSISARAR